MPINISGITLGQSTKDATALPGDVKIGKIFYGADGKYVGTLLHKNSLILADNVGDLNIITDLDSMKLLWNIPDSEISIKQFNIYLKKSNEAPTDLSQFELAGTVSGTEKTYTISGLESGSKYYVVVESVSTEDYENASLRGMRDAYVRKGYWLTFAKEPAYSDHHAYYSEDGESWKILKNKDNQDVAISTASDYPVDILVVDGKIYFGESLSNRFPPNVWYLNHNTGEMINTNFNISDTQSSQHLMYTGKRFVASACTGIQMYYSYCIGYPEETKKWVNMGRGAYALRCIAHNDILICAFNEDSNRWKYYDFNAENQWMNTGAYLSKDYGNIIELAYGNGIVMFVAEHGTSLYATWDNIKRGVFVIITEGTEGWANSFYDVIYSSKARKFFAINESGETFYMNDSGKFEWIKMNSGPWKGKLSYGNGRLICRCAQNKSWYCIDGMNWVAMTGIPDLENKDWNFDVCSLYD